MVPAEAEKTQRDRGEQFRFPHHRLERSLEVAQVIEERGSGRLRPQDLARYLNSSVKSSTFQMRLVSARLFRLVTRTGDFYQTTALAKRILAGSHRERLDALVEAFRSVPLFEESLKRFDGIPLPADDRSLDTALESEFGVRRGQGRKARQRLLSSAATAGLLQTREGKRWLLSARAPSTAHLAGDERVPQVASPEAPAAPSGHEAQEVAPSGHLDWPPIDLDVLKDWDEAKLRTYMEGLERIARAMRGEPAPERKEDEQK